MRKVVKRPDGSEEAIEGTPEEVREYERIVENDRTPKQKQMPELIKGKEDSDHSDNLRRLLERVEKIAPKEYRDRFPWWPHTSPIWITSCSSCHRNPCSCQHLWNPYGLGSGFYCSSGLTMKSVLLRPIDLGVDQNGMS